MDGREAMGFTGSGSYYMHRSMVPGSGPGTQPGLNALPSFRQMPHQALPVQSNTGGTSVVPTATFPLESSSVHGVNSPGMVSGEPLKRKRGRPRKYGPDGSASLALSPMSSTPPGAPSSQTPAQKRGRGRPPGTGSKQQLASLGELISGSAGIGFTPHVITIAKGEDIAARVMAFSQQGPRAVCILSANGAVSTVTLRQPSSSGGAVKYEGRFEILCLSGSYMLTDGGTRSRTGGLTISLAGPDGRVIGGGVAGVLIAATPVQVVVGSFLFGGLKTKNKAAAAASASAKTESGQQSEYPTGDDSTTPISLPASQAITSSQMNDWHDARAVDMRNAVQINIDLTRG